MLALRHGPVDAAIEYSASLSFRSGLSDRRENVGAENRKELPDSGQEHRYVFPFRFRKL